MKKNKKIYNENHYETIKEVFEYSTNKFSENILLFEKNIDNEWKSTTYKQFADEVISFGASLTSLMELKNKKVAIWGENSHYWYVSYMTMLCSEGITVPLDKDLPEEELLNILNSSQVDVIIFSTHKKDIIKNICNKLNTIKYFIEMNSQYGFEDKFVGIEYLIAQGKILVEKGNTSFLDSQINKDDFKVLLFTSGTTSKPKGVMLSSKNLAENINCASAYVNLQPTDRLLSILPLHHTYESSIGFLYPFGTGASIAICESLKYISQNLKEIKPTSILTVPLLSENLYKNIIKGIQKSGKEKQFKFMFFINAILKFFGINISRKLFSEIYENLGGQLKYIVSAAAPMDINIIKWFENIGITFLQGYGLTETAPIAALTPEFQRKKGSLGKAVLGAELKIDTPNENGEGEILISSPTLMLGYYNNEQATIDAIFENNGRRWFRSGDIGYLDSDGFLYMTGRSKNVIVTKNGKNIYPEELENLLKDVVEIKECIVYGKPSKLENNELIITAKIFPNYNEITKIYGKDLSTEQITEILWNRIKEINKKVPSYKIIKELEIKSDEFEKTSSMKIKRY